MIEAVCCLGFLLRSEISPIFYTFTEKQLRKVKSSNSLGKGNKIKP